MTEPRYKRGDRVDFNNGWASGEIKPNGTPGRIRRVIVTRKYVVDWEDGCNDDTEAYEGHELLRLDSEGATNG